MANQTTARTDMFQHLVLQGLWVLILLGFGYKSRNMATDFRASAIAFGDLYGNKNENSKKYRREISYGGELY